MKLPYGCQKYLVKFNRLNFRIRVIFISLIALSLFLLTLNYPRNDIRYCFVEHPTNGHTLIHLRRLDDVLLAERKPTPGRTIFFHETSCHYTAKSSIDSLFNSFGVFVHSKEATTEGIPTALTNGASLVHLSARQACAVESAALHNPNFDIFVLFASAVYSDNSTAQPILDAVLSYSNVHLRNVNLWTYAADTPIYEWLKGGKLFTSKFVLSHVSDFLRYLTLWRWGGTYLDLDLVVKRSLEDVPPNFSGAESKAAIAAGVMNFAPDGFGHDIAEQCLRDLQRNFDGRDWGNNGPGVITRVLQDVCQTNNIAIMNRERCSGFQVYPKEAFYAISWPLWEHFFEAQYLEETLKQIDNSYIAHVWNKHSMQRRVKVGSNVAYGKLAERHCPKVYAACGEFF